MERRRFSELVSTLKAWIRRKKKDPEDPYALVGAPRKPRPPLRTLRAKAKAE